jgi:hypothetical protein
LAERVGKEDTEVGEAGTLRSEEEVETRSGGADDRAGQGRGAEFCTVVIGPTEGSRAGDAAGDVFEFGVGDVELMNRRCEFARRKMTKRA